MYNGIGAFQPQEEELNIYGAEPNPYGMASNYNFAGITPEYVQQLQQAMAPKDPLSFQAVTKGTHDPSTALAFAQKYDGLGTRGRVKDWAKHASKYGDEFYDWAESVGGTRPGGGLTDWAKKIAPYGSEAYEATKDAGFTRGKGALTKYGHKYIQDYAADQFMEGMQSGMDFDPDVYLGGDGGRPLGGAMPSDAVPPDAPMQQGGTDWLGYEDTPIGQLYGTEYEQSPGYLFQLGEAEKAAKQNLAARGMSGSGAEMKELMRLAQGSAAQDYGHWQGNVAQGFGGYLSGLQGMANQGYGAAGGMANQAGAQGTAMANLAAQNAQIQGQAAMQQANIWGNVLGQGAQMAGQYMGMPSTGQQAPPQTVSNPYAQQQSQFNTPYQPYSQYGSGYITR